MTSSFLKNIGFEKPKSEQEKFLEAIAPGGNYTMPPDKPKKPRGVQPSAGWKNSVAAVKEAKLLGTQLPPNGASAYYGPGGNPDGSGRVDRHRDASTRSGGERAQWDHKDRHRRAEEHAVAAGRHQAPLRADPDLYGQGPSQRDARLLAAGAAKAKERQLSKGAGACLPACMAHVSSPRWTVPPPPTFAVALEL